MTTKRPVVKRGKKGQFEAVLREMAHVTMNGLYEPLLGRVVMLGPRGEAHASLPQGQPGRLACGCFINCPGPEYHAGEATRIQGELDRLGPEFPEDSAIRVILRERVADERKRGGG